MRIIILTTSVYGTAGHHLPILHQLPDVEIAMVVVSEGVVAKRKNQYQKRIKKILKIGILGAWNGIKMRKWYNQDIQAYCKIGNAEEYCKLHNIPFKKVPSTNSDETVKAFKEANADLGLSLGNGYIAKKVFSLPKHGMLNTHHELLPQYQNAQSIIWELYNGSDKTGYTIHKIDKHIDTGEIVLQEKTDIIFRESLGDTVSYNYAKLFDASAQGFATIFKNFDHFFFSAKPQGKGTSYTTPTYWQYLKIEKQFKRLRKLHLNK